MLTTKNGVHSSRNTAKMMPNTFDALRSLVAIVWRRFRVAALADRISDGVVVFIELRMRRNVDIWKWLAVSDMLVELGDTLLSAVGRCCCRSDRFADVERFAGTPLVIV